MEITYRELTEDELRETDERVYFLKKVLESIGFQVEIGAIPEDENEKGGQKK